MRAVFFGSPPFAAQVLRALIDHDVCICGVVTQPARPRGRSRAEVATEVAQVAAVRLGDVPLLSPGRLSDPSVEESLIEFRADVFIVAAYGGLLGKNILRIPRLACVNVHPSLLPRYRGASPIQRCLMNGDEETGVCIMHLAEELDTGDVISKEKIAIDPLENFEQLERRLCSLGCTLLLDALKALESGVAARKPQDPTLATYAPKISGDDCRLHWHRSALQLHNQIRALSPRPGAYCEMLIKGMRRRLKILEAAPCAGLGGEPGEILRETPEALVVACGSGALKLYHVQPADKAVMPGDAFLRGLPERVSLL